MSAERNDPLNEPDGRAGLRERIGTRYGVLLCLGVAAGYSVTLLEADVVSIPVVGPVPGLLAGGIGLAATVLVYRNVACCGDSGEKSSLGSSGCSCSGAWGDRCSYDS